MAELTVPQVDFSGLGNLGQVYQQAKQQRVRDQTLAALGQGGGADADTLIKSGDLSLAQLGLNLKTQEMERQRQAQRDAISDQHWASSYELQKRAAARADDRTPTGFEPNPEGGGYRPVPGGPTDPNYIKQKEEATRLDPSAIVEQRKNLALNNGIDPNSQQGKAFILTGKLPEQDTSFSTAVEQRKAAAAANGLDPASPGYQSYVLTGKMPREDAQPLTAGDKEAIRTADDAVLANKSAIDSIERAKKLSKVAFAGPMAEKGGYMASFLGESSDLGKRGIATENLSNEVMTNAVGQLKAIFGGNPTEGERKILLDLQGSVSKPDAVRQEIFERAKAAAMRRLEYNQQRADELRGGSYYKKTGMQPSGGSAAGNVTSSGVKWSVQ